MKSEVGTYFTLRNKNLRILIVTLNTQKISIYVTTSSFVRVSVDFFMKNIIKTSNFDVISAKYEGNYKQTRKILHCKK